MPALARAATAPIGSMCAFSSTEVLTERWHAAVRRGTHSLVQSFLREAPWLANATDAAGFTALMRSCVSGQLLNVLINCAACDVNATAAADRTTALLIASRYRSARVVDQLLRRGARMTRDRTGATVLHKAAANSDTSVLRLLLQTGAPPYLRDADGRCPLMVALLMGNQAAALVLLEELNRQREIERYLTPPPLSPPQQLPRSLPHATQPEAPRVAAAGEGVETVAWPATEPLAAP